MADTKWTDKETKEIKDFGIQMLTLHSINSKQVVRLCELIGNACERIKELETELQELANDMMEYYTDWDKPELLGLHQRIDNILNLPKK